MIPVPNSSSHYQVGGSLDPYHSTYVVRQADNDLYESLKAGEFCYVFNSRQMGKSSLLVRTLRRLQQEGFACADIDITQIGTQQVTPDEWYGGIISFLTSQLNLEVDEGEWWHSMSHLSPVLRLGEFLRQIVFPQLREHLIIFIDEIDSTIQVEFKDDFFAFIRACYNKRSQNPAYKRLTFALFGVATPSDLIRDKTRTPFNIGRVIELCGFNLEEAQPLIRGFPKTIQNPQAVLREILYWTGGQPFLTQKLCNLLQSVNFTISEGREQESILQLVRSQIVDNWEVQDQPEHLKTIRDRLLSNEQRAGRLLGIYQQILARTEVQVDDSVEQTELQLSGLVVKERGCLQVYNPLYALIFNATWIEKKLENLRPYSEDLSAWFKSERLDESRLLRGQRLQEAISWAESKSLSNEDHQFLTASEELEKRETQKALKAQIAATQKAQQKLRIASAILILSISTALTAGFMANKAREKLWEAQAGTRIEQTSATALRQFDYGPLDALLSAIQAGKQLEGIVKDGRNLEEYPSITPLLALQKILDRIQQWNQFKAHDTSWVRAVAYSPDGKKVATAGIEGIYGMVKIWDISGNPLTEWKAHIGPVTGLSFHPTEELIISSGSDGKVKLWDLSGQQIKASKPRESGILDVSFSYDGQYLATAESNGKVRLWSIGGEEIAEFNSNSGEIYSVSISPDGKQIATVAINSKKEKSIVQVWSFSGSEIINWEVPKVEIRDIIFHPEGHTLATAGRDGKVILWNLQGEVKKELKISDVALWGLSYSPDGQNIVVGAEDGIVRFFKVDISLPNKFDVDAKERISSLAFSYDTKQLVTVGDYTIRIWDLVSGKEVRQWQNNKKMFVLAVSFSPDDRTIATATNQGTVEILDLSGETQRNFRTNIEKIISGQFSADGRFFAALGKEGRIEIWNLSGKLIGSFTTDSQVITVSISGDGQQIATISKDGKIQLWNLSGQKQEEWESPNPRSVNVGFTPYGKLIATSGEDDSIKVWTFSEQQLAEFNPPPGQNKVIFSSDGKQLATVGEDGKVFLWQVETLDELLSRGCTWIKHYLITNDSDNNLCSNHN